MMTLDNPRREGLGVREMDVSHPRGGETSKMWRRVKQLFWQGGVEKVVQELCGSMLCVHTLSLNMVITYLRKLNTR